LLCVSQKDEERENSEGEDIFASKLLKIKKKIKNFKNLKKKKKKKKNPSGWVSVGPNFPNPGRTRLMKHVLVMLST
jgi:hypothetical protein